jgi:two-component system, NarL family, sensor kinase
MFNNKEEIFYSVILFSLFLLILIGIIITTAVLSYNRKKRYLLEKSQFENVILTAQLEIREQTFKNISQEIHDNIGQILSLAKINLSAIEEIGPERYQIENIIITKNLVSKAIQDLRNLSHGLNTDYIYNLGLTKAIEHELDIIGKSGVFVTSFNLKGELRRLERQRELILFRIVQELLNNILKHAEASLITVDLHFDTGRLLLAVTDNGKGFDPDKVIQHKDGGMGILNIYNRVKLVNATIELQSTIGKETTARMSVPY